MVSSMPSYPQGGSKRVSPSVPHHHNHRFLHRTTPRSNFHSSHDYQPPPPVTPSPSSPQIDPATSNSAVQQHPLIQPYRFETPAYVYAPESAPWCSAVEQLKGSAGCTCKKSRYVVIRCIIDTGIFPLQGILYHSSLFLRTHLISPMYL